MSQTLPSRPSLRYLRLQAKELLAQVNAGDPAAVQKMQLHHPRWRADRTTACLADVQLAIAREYGFLSWPKLKHYVEQWSAIENRVAKLQAEFAATTDVGREELLKGLHTRDRFKDFRRGATSLSETDARLVVANEEGYAFWSKYESYLNLDAGVQAVIQAVKTGDLKQLNDLLAADPSSANPHWVSNLVPEHIHNDSIPLFCLSEAVFHGLNRRGNAYELVRSLLQAGAEADIEGGTPLTGAVSYNVYGAVRALLEGGATADGPAGKGFPLSYSLYFGFEDISDLLLEHGAKTDLRFEAGFGRVRQMATYFDGHRLRDPQQAGFLSDPYEDRFRCPRTAQNVLNQALFFASMNGHQEASAWLLRHGAEINAFIPGLDVSATLLHWLANIATGPAISPEIMENKRLSIVRFLLDQGARVDIRDPRYNSTPLGWAEYMNRPQIAEIMRRYNS